MRRGLLTRLMRTRLVEPGEPATDADLLSRYAKSRDDAAFELLVWRHAVLVAGVCRRIVRDEHLAEDAFQAAFLILARKAGSIRGTNLAGWLFRVARRVAVRARRSAVARTQRETPLTIEPSREPLPHPIEHAELLAILDDEVARLPERLRLPVLLCYLGGSSTADAARLLCCPRGTILSRLSSARDRLAASLTSRGAILPAGGFLTIIALPTESAVASLVPTAVRLVIAPFANQTASRILAEGVLSAMKTTKLLAAAGMLAMTIGLLAGVGLVMGPDGTGQANAAGVQLPEAPVAEKPEPPKKSPAPSELAARLDREDRMKKLEALAERFRAEVQDKERAIQLLTDASGSSGQPTRSQDALTRLDNDLTKLQREILELETTIELFKKRLSADHFKPLDAELERGIERDGRVLEARKEVLAQQRKLEDLKQKMLKPDAPQVVAARNELGVTGVPS